VKSQGEAGNVRHATKSLLETNAAYASTHSVCSIHFIQDQYKYKYCIKPPAPQMKRVLLKSPQTDASNKELAVKNCSENLTMLALLPGGSGSCCRREDEGGKP
jgi:hypothetical protein